MWKVMYKFNKDANGDWWTPDNVDLAIAEIKEYVLHHGWNETVCKGSSWDSQTQKHYPSKWDPHTLYCHFGNDYHSLLNIEQGIFTSKPLNVILQFQHYKNSIGEEKSFLDFCGTKYSVKNHLECWFGNFQSLDNFLELHQLIVNGMPNEEFVSKYKQLK